MQYQAKGLRYIKNSCKIVLTFRFSIPDDRMGDYVTFAGKQRLMSSRNILFISSWYPDRITRSNGDFVKRHAQAAAIGNRVAVLYVKYDPAMKPGKEIQETGDGNFSEVIIYFNILSGLFSGIRKIIQYYRIYFQGYRYIRKQYFDPELVHANITYPIGILALLYRWRYGKQYIISEHWSAYLAENHSKLTFSRKLIDRFVVRRSSMILPVTRNLRDSLDRLGFRTNYAVIPNVVDVGKFSPLEEASGSRTFIHLSTLNDPVKNISGMLQATAKLSQKRQDFRLEIIGIENVEKHRQLARELGILGSFVRVEEEIDHKEVCAF